MLPDPQAYPLISIAFIHTNEISLGLCLGIFAMPGDMLYLGGLLLLSTLVRLGEGEGGTSMLHSDSSEPELMCLVV